LFSEHPIFDRSLGVQSKIDGETLVLSQDRQAQISLNEQGSVLVTVSVRRTGQMSLELIYESVQEQIAASLEYSAWAIDHVDPTQRLTHVAVAVNLAGAEHMAWRTASTSRIEEALFPSMLSFCPNI
jgi:hypothetical protein